MPLYEYACDACGERFEQIQKFSDPPLETCARCGKGPVRRLLSSPAIQFKGSGWYITDYARKGGEKGKDKDAGQGSGKAADTPKSDKATTGITPAAKDTATPPAASTPKPATPGSGSTT
ncbi:MAG: zinc ribbon domain-containing protein [Acidimicrobiia bacterium]|nr:zinc ribbon domain-containing protein [Acidimicrobiia bacterium]